MPSAACNLAGMQEFDFAIVGAGIAGVSAAYHLAPQAKVVVLEREHVAAYHTTGRSAALHSETYGSPEIRAITVASGRFYRQPPPGFTDHPLLTPRGALLAGRANEQAAAQEAAREFAKLVPSVRWLEPAEVLRRQPLLKPEACAGGAVFEEAEDMDVAAIHSGFLKGARAAGSVLRLNAEVTTLERRGGRWTIRLAGGETVAAANLINASGAWADVVANLAGAKPVGLVPKRRTAFTFDAPVGLALERMPMVIDFRRDLVHQARSRPVPRLAGRRDAIAADGCPAGGNRHRPGCRAHPGGDDTANTSHQEQMGRAQELRRRQEPGGRATTGAPKASSGWPARVATASRPRPPLAASRQRWPWAKPCQAILPSSASAKRRCRPRASRRGDRKITLRRQAMTSC